MQTINRNVRRICVLKELLLNEINKLLSYVQSNKDTFIQRALEQTNADHLSEVKQAKKMIVKSEKRIAEIDKLFDRLYEDNVSCKISDERFEQMSENFESEQKQLKAKVAELKAFLETKEQQNSDSNRFMDIVSKYEQLTDITPQQMHELIERIEVHTPDKSSGHRQQKVDIYFRFKAAKASAILDRRDYDKRKSCVAPKLRSLFLVMEKLLYYAPCKAGELFCGKLFIGEGESVIRLVLSLGIL